MVMSGSMKKYRAGGGVMGGAIVKGAVREDFLEEATIVKA